MKMKEKFPKLKKEDIRPELNEAMEKAHGPNWFEEFLEFDDQDAPVT